MNLSQNVFGVTAPKVLGFYCLESMRMSSREEIFQAISRERDYQDKKWGIRDHQIASWMAIMKGEMNEADIAWLKEGDKNTLKEILQVIAVGVACLERHGVVERDD
jgi:hypothetical protein